MASTRTDVHSPANLQTENYEFLGCLDWHAGQDGDRGGVMLRMQLINRVIVDAGRKWAAIHPNAQCDHCGAHIRYAALLLHTPSNEVIEVGETCLDNRFSRATSEFQKLREAAQLDREAQRVKAAIAEFSTANPDLAFLASGEIPVASVNNSFIVDVGFKLRRYGSLSDAQMSAVRKALVRDVEYANKKAVSDSQKVAVVEGKITINGEVLSTKIVDSMYGSTLKMRVADDRGFTLWGSVPKAIDFVKKGDRVRFSATVEASKDDKSFGYYSRPTQAVIL